MRLLIPLIGALFLFACGDPGSPDSAEGDSSVQDTMNSIGSGDSEPSPRTANREPRIALTTFQNEDGSWGYEIAVNDRRMIHQPHRPAIGGKAGFANEKQAQAVGELVMYKIEHGIMPPSVTAVEVDSMEMLYK